jgi:hypothetical protein
LGTSSSKFWIFMWESRVHQKSLILSIISFFFGWFRGFFLSTDDPSADQFLMTLWELMWEINNEMRIRKSQWCSSNHRIHQNKQSWPRIFTHLFENCFRLLFSTSLLIFWKFLVSSGPCSSSQLYGVEFVDCKSFFACLFSRI